MTWFGQWNMKWVAPSRASVSPLLLPLLWTSVMFQIVATLPVWVLEWEYHGAESLLDPKWIYKRKGNFVFYFEWDCALGFIGFCSIIYPSLIDTSTFSALPSLQTPYLLMFLKPIWWLGKSQGTTLRGLPKATLWKNQANSGASLSDVKEGPSHPDLMLTYTALYQVLIYKNQILHGWILPSS